ncbi:hypothetical protein ACFQVC_14450 [Streptomyces monticola]|uniref:Lipoprotein n=1 Tax=Streptomyces monticola TaxID=2666263 RepID=A0ABW2JIW2_9ACTN
MRKARSRGAVRAGALLLLAALGTLTSCQKSPAPGDGRLGEEAVSVAPSDFGATFLAVDECSSRGGEFTEVACTSEKAQARVLARHDGTQSRGPRCPDITDFVLHISESRPAAERGYACMRNLEAPHPGDPGGGGGPRTLVGDCLYDSQAGEVRETPCDGSGEHPPRYRVTSAVTARSGCPPETSLYVRLGGARPVGCARSV